MIYTRHTAKARNKLELIGTKRLLINGRYELEDILKRSSNIINLIEVGDYVNGFFVIQISDGIDNYNETVILAENYEEWTNDRIFTNKDIKNIVTKELFNSIKYEVK